MMKIVSDEADVSDREAENEGSVVGAAATAKLPLASKLDVCYHNNCSRTASFGFQGKHPILCGKIISTLKPQNFAKLQQ